MHTRPFLAQAGVDPEDAKVTFGGEPDTGDLLRSFGFDPTASAVSDASRAAQVILSALRSSTVDLRQSDVAAFQIVYNRDVGSSLRTDGVMDADTHVALEHFVGFGTDLNEATGSASNVHPTLEASYVPPDPFQQIGYNPSPEVRAAMEREYARRTGEPMPNTQGATAERDVQYIYPLDGFQGEFGAEGDDYLAASALRTSVTPATISTFQKAYNGTGASPQLSVSGVMDAATQSALLTYQFQPTATLAPNTTGYAPPPSREAVWTSSNIPTSATPALSNTAVALNASRGKTKALVLPFQQAFNASGASVHLAEDGAWGPQTAAALAALALAPQTPKDLGSYPIVVAFQKFYNAAFPQNQIGVDGQYGPQTAAALSRYAPAGIQAPLPAGGVSGVGSVLGASPGVSAPSRTRTRPTAPAVTSVSAPAVVSVSRPGAVPSPSSVGAKELSTGQQMAVGAGAAIVVGILGWLGFDMAKGNGSRGAATVRTARKV